MPARPVPGSPVAWCGVEPRRRSVPTAAPQSQIFRTSSSRFCLARSVSPRVDPKVVGMRAAGPGRLAAPRTAATPRRATPDVCVAVRLFVSSSKWGAWLIAAGTEWERLSATSRRFPPPRRTEAEAPPSDDPVPHDSVHSSLRPPFISPFPQQLTSGLQFCALALSAGWPPPPHRTPFVYLEEHARPRQPAAMGSAMGSDFGPATR